MAEALVIDHTGRWTHRHTSGTTEAANRRRRVVVGYVSWPHWNTNRITSRWENTQGGIGVSVRAVGRKGEAKTIKKGGQVATSHKLGAKSGRLEKRKLSQQDSDISNQVHITKTREKGSINSKRGKPSRRERGIQAAKRDGGKKKVRM